MSAATGLQRIELYTHYDQPLSDIERASLREGIKRRVAGEPLQYILGKAPFRHLELKVIPGVLIPRPETEVLVDVVLDAVTGEPSATQTTHPAPALRAPRILDIGTGTGAIALSLLSELPGCTVVASDIDPAAVGLALANAQLLELDNAERLHIILDDLASSLIADPAYHASFDVVASNPPYIPTALLTELPSEVAQYESNRALDGGEDGLDVYRRILEQAAVLLKPSGLLAVELHEDRLAQASELARQAGFTDVHIHRDLTGRDRILTASR
jgi:release factor glutamine methyltransferase